MSRKRAALMLSTCSPIALSLVVTTALLAQTGDPACPEGSTSPELFASWYERAIQWNAEMFEDQHGRPPAVGELQPLLPEQIAANLEILCDCSGPPVIEGSCTPNATTLCIDDEPGDQRFGVRVTYQTSQGGGVMGEGNAVSLSGLGFRRGGLFWFFSEDNPEILIKVLNGCGSNGHYWVFLSAATNLGLTVNAVDTQTGATVTFTNPDRRVAPPFADILAFPCQ